MVCNVCITKLLPCSLLLFVYTLISLSILVFVQLLFNIVIRFATTSALNFKILLVNTIILTWYAGARRILPNRV